MQELLVQFAIETKAIDNSATPAHIARLLDRWGRFGILVYPRRGDPALTDRISKLPQTARKHWKTAWAKIAKNNGNAYRWVSTGGCVIEWNKVFTPESLASFDDEFEVAVLDESRAAALEVPDGEGRRCGKVEAIRLRDVDVSEEFSLSETLGSAPIDIGESTEDIWSRRFQRFAAHSRHVVVVDRYAVRNLDGILRLLRWLNRDARRCRVTVYSCLDARVGGARLIEGRVKAEVAPFSGRGLGSVGVRLFRDKDFRRYADDRHLRFDNSVFRIGRGMTIFERDLTRDATDVHFVVLPSGTRDKKETDLEQSGRMVHRFRVRLV